MGGEGEAEELFKAKVEGGETPPSSLLDFLLTEVRKRRHPTGDGETCGWRPPRGSSQSAVMATLQAGRTSSVCFQQLRSLKVMRSKSPTCSQTRDGRQRRVGGLLEELQRLVRGLCLLFITLS